MSIFKKKLNGKPIGLGAQIADILTRAILEGELKSGSQLLENDLQKHFGISRSPLREAFRELEKKGFVDIIPRKGTFIKKITKKDIQENFPIRAVLEGLAAKIAFVNMTDVALTQMGKSLDKMKAAVEKKNIKSYYTNHRNFHEIFIKLSKNELLQSLLQNLRMQSLWHMFSYKYYQEDMEKSLQYHQRILKFFQDANTDPDGLEDLVKHHINVALQQFLNYQQEESNDDFTSRH